MIFYILSQHRLPKCVRLKDFNVAKSWAINAFYLRTN